MKTPLEVLECSMDGLECSAEQATKQKYIQLDQNNYPQLKLSLHADHMYSLSRVKTYFVSILGKMIVF